MPKTTTIDVHPHIISDDDTRYPRAPLFGIQSDWSQERPTTIEDMIRAMDAAGVQKSAIVQASTCYGHDNSYLADSIAPYKGRLTGICSVDIRAPDAVEKLRYWQSRGMSGLRLFTGGSTAAFDSDWIDDPSTFPAWDHAMQTWMPVCLQMSSAGFPRLRNILREFPRLIILLDHFARPDISDGPPYAAASPLFALAELPQVYLKLTPRIFMFMVYEGKATPETFFAKVVSEFGASRIAWGSNYPSTKGSLPEILATARKALATVSDADKSWIFAKTAQLVYPSLADR
jgi:predicted TIM-barrel fold metal-dependent hydrolase